MRKVSSLILVALALWPNNLFAQAPVSSPAPSPLPQSITSNGITMLAIEPAPAAPQGTPPVTS
jgi:hypothetical protein